MMTTESEYYDGPNYIGPTDCAFCGENLDDAEEQGPFTADAWKALADVRTLDEWRAAAVAPRKRAYEFDENGTLFICEWEPFARMGQVREGFSESTPDEARAKAAAWVRGLK